MESPPSRRAPGARAPGVHAATLGSGASRTDTRKGEFQRKPVQFAPSLADAALARRCSDNFGAFAGAPW